MKHGKFKDFDSQFIMCELWTICDFGEAMRCMIVLWDWV